MKIMHSIYRVITPFYIRKLIYRHIKQWRESKDVVRILVDRYHLKKERKYFGTSIFHGTALVRLPRII